MLFGTGIFLSIILLLVIVLSPFDLFQPTDSNTITGKATLPTYATIYQPNSTTCSIDLYQGWNFISIYCIPLAASTELILASINESYTYIFNYEAADATDHWKSYNRELPSWAVQQLTNISRASGYWIYMAEDATFTYDGSLRSTTISFRSGWNMIGYPRNESENITALLSNVSFTQVREFNTLSNTWYVYQRNDTGNTLTNFTPGKGYWVNNSLNQTLTFYP